MFNTVSAKSPARNVLTLLLFSTRSAKSPEYLWSKKPIGKRNIWYKNVWAKLIGAIFAGLNITSTLKASGAENEYISRIQGFYAKAILLEQKLGRLQQVLNAIPAVANEITNVLVMMVGGVLVINGQMTAAGKNGPYQFPLVLLLLHGSIGNRIRAAFHQNNINDYTAVGGGVLLPLKQRQFHRFCRRFRVWEVYGFQDCERLVSSVEGPGADGRAALQKNPEGNYGFQRFYRKPEHYIIFRYDTGQPDYVE